MPAQWESRKNGPDWTDVKTYLNALDALHGCSSTLTAQPDGSAASLQWLVGIVAVWPDLEGVANFATAAVMAEWPNSAQRTLEACAYMLCHQLDHHIAQTMYKQQQLA